jgi:hypothetical protein
MTHKFTPRYHDEAGYWYCEKLVHMSLPECYGEFEDEFKARLACNCLEQIESNFETLSKYFNINLRLTEVKRD